MNTIAVVYPPEYSELGTRIEADLEKQGFTVSSSVQPGSEPILVVLLSPQATQEKPIMQAVEQALDNHQQIIPIIEQPIELPRIIGNLETIDFSTGYNVRSLLQRIEALSAPDAPAPLTALTASRRKANRQSAYVLVGVVAFVFVVAIAGVIAGIFQPPADEFAGVDTQVFLTRSYYIDRALPVSTEQAADFEATIPHIPTLARIPLIETATAISAGVDSNFVPRSTQDATQFPVTLKAVSTIVHDRLQATVTQQAMTAAAITPTPGAPVSETPQG